MLISEEQRDILGEIVNIGIGRAAAALNDMVGHHIQLQIPHIEVFDEHALQDHWLQTRKGKTSSVYMDFNGTFAGNAALMFPPESAAILIATLTDEPPHEGEMDALCVGTLTEVGNILINGVIGSISNALNANMRFSLPSYIECEAHDLINHTQLKSATILIANTTFSIDELQ
ncbi:MAG: chemotaxis protein CheX, partial [Mariprofundaceae bacterium]|nr:chemotaxis protein CheX [Mariprofundaceae bacterium]